MMKFGHIEVFARDPLASLPFYRDILGFEEVAVQGNTCVWLKLGEMEILLRPGQGPQPAPDYPQAPTGFVLYTDDLNATMERLTARGLTFNGADADGAPAFTDPDGNWFQLAAPGSM